MNAIASGSLTVHENNSFSDPTIKGRASSAAKEFESILLGQWLKDAESSFGRVPGSEEDDACGEQMKEFAMQHIAIDLTNRGGIGIAPMVEKALVSQRNGEDI